jgi:UDP-N-acetylenolpyruvoylglucosamine reductase
MAEITKKTIEQLYRYFPELTIKFDVPWSQLTTLGVGNTVPLVIDPIDDLTLSQFLRYCYSEDIKILPIGAGSNIVGTDKSFPGIILRLRQNDFVKVKISHVHATIGAGVGLYDFITACAHKNLGGIAQLAGIPGTIGGSLRTNAGRLGVTVSDFIEEICGFDLLGNSWCADAKEIEWSYRHSSIPEDVIVTAVIFKMDKVISSVAIAAMQESIFARNNIYPTYRNAGCVFRNPPSGHGAGKLIEIAGCKGLSIGNIEVSAKHANFIVNKAEASEKDFLDLAVKVKKQVLDNTGIYLEPEVHFANSNSFSALTSNPEKLKVAVIKGGNSHERAVSLESAKNVSGALKEAGYRVVDVDIQEPIITEEIKEADIVFPMLHGGFGEDGRIQKELEKFKLPYVGCNSKVSETIIDKIKTKEFFHKHDVLIPEYAVLKHGETAFPENLSLPVVLKPPTEGSTFGVSIVKDMSSWKPALDKAAIDSTGLILVEEYIHGPELTVGILDGVALPMIHICYPGEMYDYDAKYTHETGETKYISPPNSNMFSLEFQKEVKQTALTIYNEINARDMLRVDLIVSSKNNLAYYIEANTIPGFTSSSLLPKAAAHADIPYIQLCGTLVQLAYGRKSIIKSSNNHV